MEPKNSIGNSSDLIDLKKKLKVELKKELLEEIYMDLKAEEKQTELIEEEDILKESIPINQKLQKKKNIEDEKSKSVEITIKAFLKISSHALKYANKNVSKNNWVEVLGLLAGSYKNKNLIIEDVYPMGHGNAIYADIKDYNNYMRAYTDLQEKGLFICGWYHSHPSYGLFMSDEDVGTQMRYQRLWNNSIALVVDPDKINGKSYGFEIFRLKKRSKEWFSVPFSILGAPDKGYLPDLLDFIQPIVDGKALFLEYDED